ncbi:hypothetical protein HK25_08190 [Acetobacter sp. DsW_059]|nr:hypothetical protein HK25_08190 [Acetobacter sp. DsW_059]
MTRSIIFFLSGRQAIQPGDGIVQFSCQLHSHNGDLMASGFFCQVLKAGNVSGAAFRDYNVSAKNRFPSGIYFVICQSIMTKRHRF